MPASNLPKPPGARARRNLDNPKWKSIAADGAARSAPDIGRCAAGREWLKSTTDWWEQIWSSPMSVMWMEADHEGLRRLAMLRDWFHRGETGARDLASIQQLEDRYGLNPKARRALQWEVTQARKREEDEAEIAAAPARPTSNVRRLRAVDPEADTG